MKPISRKKLVVFAAATAAFLFFALCAVFLAADFYVHRKFENAAGLNIWGYRGPVLGRKPPDEIRVAVLGGSTALGFGLPWTEAFPHYLEVALNHREAASPERHYVAVNLGFNNNGAYSFLFTLQDYAYLSYDIVCLYEGYNDLGDAQKNVRVSRRDSGIYRLTGYYPLLPVVAAEKAMQLRYGDLRAAYKGKAVVFRPNLADRAKASALETSTALLRALERTQDSGTQKTMADLPPTDSEGCSPRWAFYCHSVAVAVAEARRQHKAVLVVTQPYVNADHRDQQRELQAMIADHWGGDPAVRYVDLGNAVDLADPALCWDGVHLTAVGNQKIAAALRQPVLDVVARVGS